MTNDLASWIGVLAYWRFWFGVGLKLLGITVCFYGPLDTIWHPITLLGIGLYLGGTAYMVGAWMVALRREY